MPFYGFNLKRKRKKNKREKEGIYFGPEQKKNTAKIAMSPFTFQRAQEQANE